jgi:hypothetical protein
MTMTSVLFVNLVDFYEKNLFLDFVYALIFLLRFL